MVLRKGCADCGIFWVSSLIFLGPVVQSIISLTSSLVVKMLIVLVSTISNSQIYLLKNLYFEQEYEKYQNFYLKIFLSWL